MYILWCGVSCMKQKYGMLHAGPLPRASIGKLYGNKNQSNTNTNTTVYSLVQRCIPKIIWNVAYRPPPRSLD